MCIRSSLNTIKIMKAAKSQAQILYVKHTTKHTSHTHTRLRE